MSPWPEVKRELSHGKSRGEKGEDGEGTVGAAAAAGRGAAGDKLGKAGKAAGKAGKNGDKFTDPKPSGSMFSAAVKARAVAENPRDMPTVPMMADDDY